MRRGTTPTHTFTIPDDIDISAWVVIYITYSQFGRTQLEKNIDEININEQVLSVHLTQEETLAFKKGAAGVQIRARDAVDEAYASEEMPFTVQDVYKKGKI